MTTAGTSGQQFERVLRYIQERTGIRLPETKYKALGEYLSGFGNDLDFGSFTRHAEGTGVEGFLDAVTINETYFFREQRHFSLLRSRLLDSLAARAKPLRIWSAACSSGEEALSLAALAWSQLGEGGARVYASDISPRMLAKLETGLYSQGSLREDGRGFHELLEPFIERVGGKLRVRPALLDSIVTRVVNLSDSRYPEIPDELDLVFMRNVLMYMPMETRHRILGRVSGKLAGGGYLFVSSSEIPHLAHPDLTLKEYDGCYYFQKKDQAEKSKGMLVNGDSFRRQLAVTPVCPDAKEASVSMPAPGAAELGVPTASAKPLGQAGPVCGKEAAGFATLRLNNPVFEAEGEAAFDAAIHYLEAMYCVNSGCLDGLPAFIRKGEARWGVTSISAYFRGLAASASSDTGGGVKGTAEGAARASAGMDTAESAYREALAIDGTFWPARLNLAMLLRKREPQAALMELLACTDGLEAYIDGQEFQYQFLLEGFNARYFLDLCRGWIRKLQSGGAGNGS